MPAPALRERFGSGAIVAALLLAATACGDETARARTAQAEAAHAAAMHASAAGREVYERAGCGDCHTLAAARSTGTRGPNLDERGPSFETVRRQVEAGGGGMPSFQGRLTEREIRDVAAFVSQVARGGGRAGIAAAFEPDGTTLADCGHDFGCLEQAFGNVAYRRGPKAALALFERTLASQPRVETDCHRIAHMIGAATLARFDGDVGRALAAGSATCWSGYYHGVVERGLAGVGDEKLAEAARALCEDEKLRAGPAFVLYQCVHGLGHGLMITTGYDLPLSLRVCDRLAARWDRQSCTGGVFMENLSSSYGVRSRWLRDDDLIYPCDDVAERHKLYCYLMVTSRILPAVRYDWRKTARICRESEPRWVATCFQSLGRDASGETRQNAREIVRICALAQDRERECIYGAVRDVASNDASPQRAARVCRRSRASVRSYCFFGLGTVVATLTASPEASRSACRRVSGAYARACIRGLGAR
ncbi:MAG: cytochrome c [Actinomycetota bacterium]|nr:cytochrome c [Actinomycetota bacterium]